MPPQIHQHKLVRENFNFDRNAAGKVDRHCVQAAGSMACSDTNYLKAVSFVKLTTIYVRIEGAEAQAVNEKIKEGELE